MQYFRRIAVALSLVLAGIAMVIPGPAPAVEPDEVLDNPALEARAREISSQLRCVVCRSESIDESNADIARDMRLLVRERLLEGDSNQEVLDHFVERYGEYVLLQPTTEGANILLWIAGPTMLVIAFGGAVLYLRRRQRAAEPGAGGLSSEEEARLKRILER
ncbi:cytochrome C biogenesis protein CcdA [Rhodobacteraceae bacterium WD3A24]|nr:cytochrome C biogenesis protein CcdA [Rhodobacteraceae bacterium WD3A24]